MTFRPEDGAQRSGPAIESGSMHHKSGVSSQTAVTPRAPYGGACSRCRCASRWLLAVLLLACACTRLHAQPPQVVLPPERPSLSLDTRSEVLEDRSRSLEMESVRRIEYGWRRSPPGGLAPGFSHSVWWERLRIHNASAGLQRQILEIDSPLQDFIDVYLLTPDGHLDAHYAMGDRRPYADRPIDDRTPAVPIDLPPDASVDVYLRVDTHDGLYEALPLRLWQAGAFHVNAARDSLVMGLYYGMLLALLLYNTFLFAATRDAAFGYYAIYVLCFAAWNFTFSGFAFRYWWPQHPDFGNQALAVSAALCFLSFCAFAMSYLEVRTRAPKYACRLLQTAMVLSALCVIPPLTGRYAFSFAAIIVAGLFALGAGAHISRILRRQSKPARYFSVAFTVLGFSVGLYLLRLLSLIPTDWVGANTMQVGSVLEMLLLAFGLADQMNTLKAQKLDAERAALAAQTDLAARLEQQVQERTRELQAANQRLASIAITDELTGAFNRRHFNEVFAAELRRRRRNDQRLAFCILDVDYFKSYNDSYGHQKGDDVLHAFAAAIRGSMRRQGDKLFRLGGEEFGIVMDVESAAEATQFVDRLRQLIEDLAIPHGGTPFGCVTASFGVVVVEGGGDAEAMNLYARADALLYQSKAAGRNRVSSGPA
jgi:diguanylate cyclase